MITRLFQRKLLVILVSSGTIFLSVFVLFIVRGPMKLNAFKAEMIAQGDVLDFKHLILKHPPQDENAANQIEDILNSLGNKSYA